MENTISGVKRPVILLTGGSGFLGKAIVRELLDENSLLKPAGVRIFDLKPYTGPRDERISVIRGDVRDPEALDSACDGVDLVIHSAAIIDWGTHSRDEVLTINTEGTRNVIVACRKNKVPFLVYTSSLDAVYSGKPLVDVDEKLPYPEKHRTSYCESKRRAEELVITANGKDLKTVVLRPSDVYGEEDPYHIGSLVDMAKTGFYIRLGNGQSKCQHVYVGNMAYAHVLAAKALLDGNSRVAGKVYFVTDGLGTNFFRFFDPIIRGAGYKFFPKNLWLPRWIAYPMGAVSEFIAWMVNPVYKYTPKFSRFAVTYTCTDFTFKTSRARDDFGFEPKYPEVQAIGRTIAHYRKLREGKPEEISLNL